MAGKRAKRKASAFADEGEAAGGPNAHVDDAPNREGDAAATLSSSQTTVATLEDLVRGAPLAVNGEVSATDVIMVVKRSALATMHLRFSGNCTMRSASQSWRWSCLAGPKGAKPLLVLRPVAAIGYQRLPRMLGRLCRSFGHCRVTAHFAGTRPMSWCDISEETLASSTKLSSTVVHKRRWRGSNRTTRHEDDSLVVLELRVFPQRPRVLRHCLENLLPAR